MGSNLLICDDRVFCPECGSENLVHAFDTTYRGKLAVRDGEIVASGHIVSGNENPSEDRIYCVDCDFTEEQCERDDNKRIKIF